METDTKDREGGWKGTEKKIKEVLKEIENKRKGKRVGWWEDGGTKSAERKKERQGGS